MASSPLLRTNLPLRLAATMGAGIGLGFLYFFIKFLRRKSRPSSQKSNQLAIANGSLHAAPKSKTAPSTSSSYKRQRRPSNSSTTASEINRVTFKDDITTYSDTPIILARDSFMETVRQLERAVTFPDTSDYDTDDQKLHDKNRLDNLERLLDKAYQLREEVNDFISSFSPEMSNACESNRYLTYNDIVHKSSRRTMSVLSDDSFASALEDIVPPILDLDVTITRPIESDLEDLILYQEGLKEVDNLNVACRVLRTEFLKCKSDDDFLAKLYGVRLAFDNLLKDCSKRDWLISTGRILITALLDNANKDPLRFHECYEKMISFASDENNWPKIEDDLRHRKLVEFSFYDVVLDFIFMDAFDDLANPPASVVAVAQNRFLSSRIVETTLSAVVWSVLKAKRARLKNSDGFIAHFYDISEHVSPTMAWGFLGTDQKLKDLCNYFKSQVCNFLIDLFNCERVRFTCAEDLAEDVWTICQMRAKMTREMLEK